jgi:hypothetical protein
MTRSVYLPGGVHLLLSSGHYIGQVREIGHRRFETVTGNCQTMEAALSKAAKRMKNRHRLRVLFIDSNPYYEPNVAFEGTR